MTDTEFATVIASNLPYTPNSQQTQVIGALARFCAPGAPEDSVFVLNGYAGTGKTSLCAALVRSLHDIGMESVLLAPTGRAAKVFSGYAGRQAYTIHRAIYRHIPTPEGEFNGRDTRQNTHSNTIFIVDEASMITSDGPSNVLEDLIHYVYTGAACRLILLGDTAQLPPVGCEKSPALDTDVLKGYGLRVTRATLTEIARQGACSGILRNATMLRRAMRQTPLPEPKLLMADDVSIITPEDMPEELYNAYSRDGAQETIVITRSNQRAVAFNREIRASVLYIEEEIAPGELLVVAKNNYFWTAKDKDTGFIANGDILQVTEVIAREEKYGFRWADVILSMPSGDTSFQAKILLDSLISETANIPQESINRLYYAIMDDPDLFGPYTPADARLKALKTNPYWNALHVKYAYAVTCHKAQGGQWRNVMVDMTYIPAEAMGMDFYRWLYTAVTRATQHLYIVRTPNFD